MAARLSHTNARGQVHMVDVGAKPESLREAVAVAEVRMSRATLALAVGAASDPASVVGPLGSLAGGVKPRRGGGKAGPSQLAKGDVLATARVAAIAALKRTADWIPLCHPVRVVGTEVEIEPMRDDTIGHGLRIEVTVRAFDRTGVEMEAMVGAAAAALTVYDMLKGVERGVEIRSVRLEKKSGGSSGLWTRGVVATGAGPRTRGPRGRENRGR